ncbi:hypothetical protein AB0K25_19675 [Micromonospora sp. NPDC049257]|uniref:hypothetical protein n=1 Tax=Micromonospora sp. NPDC049257 TaxID=3155771 RepID=UPI0034220A30
MVPAVTEAVVLAKLHDLADIDRALGTAALAGRFSDNDLLRLLAHQRGDDTPATRASETHSL